MKIIPQGFNFSRLSASCAYLFGDTFVRICLMFILCIALFFIYEFHSYDNMFLGILLFNSQTSKEHIKIKNKTLPLKNDLEIMLKLFYKYIFLSG